jgi:hypothetical protein
MLRWVIRLRIEISDSRFSNNFVVSLLLITALIATLSFVSYDPGSAPMSCRTTTG